MLNDPLPPGFNKQYFTKKFLGIVFAISSKDYQKRVWIEGIGPEAMDYDETCMFLDDCNYYIEKYPKELGLTKKQKEMIAEFKQEFDEFSDENDWPPDFIDEPEWTRITEMAKEVLLAFNYKKQ